MHSRALVILAIAAGAVAATPAAADVIPVRVRPLPNDRTAVVVGWRPRAGTAVVALRSGSLLAIHSLRRIRIGTRVQVQGIKWGTPTLGVRWSVAPRGIKWGIKWALNGTYSSNMLRRGIATGIRVRGTVVRRYRNGLAIGVRGGIVVVRMAVWLPGGSKVTKSLAAITLPAVGDRVLTRVRFGRRARLIGNGVRIERRHVPGQVIPMAGRVSGVDAASRTIRISNVADPAFPLTVPMRVPATMDISRVRVGAEVAATSRLEADGALQVQEIAPNQSFEAGNDPANILVASPPADQATLDLIWEAIVRWKLGRTQGGILSGELFGRELGRLNRVNTAALDGDLPAALAELQLFIADVTAGVPTKVTVTVAADMLSLSGAIVVGLSR